MSQKIHVHHALQSLISRCPHFLELRYHDRRTRSMGVRRGEVSDMSSKHFEGLGIRILIDGTWGFASTSDLSGSGLEKALKAAEHMALELRSRKKEKVTLGSARLAKGEFVVDGYNELYSQSNESKFETVQKSEAALRKSSQLIEGAMCQYTEIFEDKWILTSDGADAHVKLARPELRMIAFAGDGNKKTMNYQIVGVTGAWDCLFLNRPLELFIELASSGAVELLKAPEARGGKKKVIMSPALVGLLCHEAIGHTVEADFVQSGSVAQGKMGQMVASDLVNLCDSGFSEYAKGAGGLLPVDDEGVLTEKTYIITQGKLTSYLHNRESAHKFGVSPTGNARAWEYNDEPLIRMRNTYIEPGTSKLSDMIEGIDDGYFVDGPEGGQADSTGEFMFGANRVREIKNGKLGSSVQNVTLSGLAFDVLQSVDAVSEDFLWDMGGGHCGKGQPAKVDAGGPYIRCEVLVGGAQ